MRNSVKTHAYGIEAPPLDDADLVDARRRTFPQRLRLLSRRARHADQSDRAAHAAAAARSRRRRCAPWSDRELFWIVKNGIKYTGMPAWAAQQRDDEVWAVVAFLRRLPSLDAQSYRELALGGLPSPAAERARDRDERRPRPSAVGACARCHGAERQRPASALVPILHGQPAEFLTAALEAYAQRPARKRHHAAGRGRSRAASDLERVARYYAGSAAAAGRATCAPTRRCDRARTRARRAGRCRSTDSRLRRLPRRRRAADLSAPRRPERAPTWRTGCACGRAASRPAPDGEAIMAPIARALSDEQIDDVAAYFASLPASAPAAAP